MQLHFLLSPFSTAFPTLKTHQGVLEKLTVLAFGSKSLKSSFLAPDENQDGQENSALYICSYHRQMIKKLISRS
jgi:hypothetical protein